MKSRISDMKLNPSTMKYEKVDSQYRATTSSKMNSKDRSRKRLELKEHFDGIIKDDSRLRDIIRRDYPQNLRSLVNYDLKDVTNSSFSGLVERAPLAYKWLFVSIFKKGLTIPELYNKYYKIEKKYDYRGPINISGLYSFVKEALQNTYFAILDDYTYEGDYDTISKFRNLPLLESTLIATYGDTLHLDDHSKELVWKMLSEIIDYHTVDYSPVLAYYSIYVRGNTETGATELISNNLATYKGATEEYTRYFLKKDLDTFYGALKKYIAHDGKVPFIQCLGYSVAPKMDANNGANNSPEDDTSDSIKDIDMPIKVEEKSTSDEVKVSEDKAIVGSSDDLTKVYDGMNWEYLAGLCKEGLKDVIFLFSDPFDALSRMKAAGVVAFPNGNELSLETEVAKCYMGFLGMSENSKASFLSILNTNS